MTTAAELVQSLEGVKRSGAGFVARCPAHDDREPSLSISDGDKGVVVHCHAGCAQEAVLDALESRGVAIRKPKNGNGNGHAHELIPLTVSTFATAKGLDAKLLDGWGVSSAEPPGSGVYFGYANAAGEDLGWKLRRSMSGDRGFTWNKGAKPGLYGLWRLADMLAIDQRLIICEGESDALTLWSHDFTALGLPGASMWKDEWLADLPQQGPLYVVIEPDKGGQTVLAAFAKSEVRNRVRLVRMTTAHKDPSALYLADPSAFMDRFESLIAAAVPLEAEPEPRKKIRLRQAAEIVDQPIKAAWLLRPYLEQMVLGLLYGELGSLKSFVTLDLLMSLAAGQVWGDSSFVIKPRPVVYISAEGKGLEKRLRAWALHHAIPLKDLPFYAIEHAVDLSQTPNVDELLAEITALGIEPALIAIDTLSKNKGALNENESADMSTFLNQLDAKIRQPLKCSVLLVHHVGHTAKERSRGSYVLMGDTDANYLVERPDPKELTIKITTGRLKDSESPPPLFLKARVVDLGTQDDDGENETSLVLLPTEERPNSAAAKRPIGRRQLDILKILEQKHREGIKSWSISECRDWARSMLSMSKQSAHDAVNALIANKFLTQSIGGLVLANEPN